MNSRINRIKFIIGALALISSGCSSPKVEKVDVTLDEQTQYSLQPADVPLGVVEYCWEEPIAAPESNGPGINEDRTWYVPAHTAVRQVRGGKWRPCDQKSAANDGGTIR